MRDILVDLAAARVFRARWTDAIHDEWLANLLLARPDLDATRLARMRNLMNEAVPGCLVTGFSHLVDAVQLPDPGDRHVLAAAIVARADVIVTFNIVDFPNQTLAQHSLTALHPDEFLNQQLDASETAVLKAARRCRTRLRRPPMSVADYLAILERQGLDNTALRLRSHGSAL